MHFHNEKCQWHAWSKDALVFPVQEMYLVSTCIWNEDTSNTVHNTALAFQADYSSQANRQYTGSQPTFIKTHMSFMYKVKCSLTFPVWYHYLGALQGYPDFNCQLFPEGPIGLKSGKQKS